MTRFLVLLICLCLGCGRASPPIAPEVLAPAAVKDLVITAEANAVLFTWKAPEEDARGKDLKKIDGYMLFRKEAVADQDEELIAKIPDTHLEILNARREEARKASKSIRKVKIEDSLKTFSYKDIKVKNSVEYLYRIVPYNQGGVEGLPSEQYRVFFSGNASVINVVTAVN